MENVHTINYNRYCIAEKFGLGKVWQFGPWFTKLKPSKLVITYIKLSFVKYSKEIRFVKLPLPSFPAVRYLPHGGSYFFSHLWHVTSFTMTYLSILSPLCHMYSRNNDHYLNVNILYVTRFAKTQHNDAFVEIQIFASVSSIYLKLCSVAISVLYCKYFLSYKAI